MYVPLSDSSAPVESSDDDEFNYSCNDYRKAKDNSENGNTEESTNQAPVSQASDSATSIRSANGKVGNSGASKGKSANDEAANGSKAKAKEAINSSSKARIAEKDDDKPLKTSNNQPSKIFCCMDTNIKEVND